MAGLTFWALTACPVDSTSAVGFLSSYALLGPLEVNLTVLGGYLVTSQSASAGARSSSPLPFA